MEQLDRAATCLALVAAPLIVVDLDGVVRAGTAEAGQLLGSVDTAGWIVSGIDRAIAAGGWQRMRIVPPDGAPQEFDGSVGELPGEPAPGYVVTLRAVGAASPRLRAGGVLDRLPEPILAELGGRLVYANPAGLRLFGVDDLAALHDWVGSGRHVSDDDRQRVRARLAAVRRGEQLAGPAEYRLLRPDGTTRIVEWMTSPVAVDGETMLIYTLVDLTAERATGERLRRLAECLPVAVFETDVHGQCVYVNDRWCRFSGRSASEAIGNGWRAAIHPDDMAALDAAFAGAIREHPVGFSFRYLRPDGSSLPVHAEAVPLFEAGTIVGWIGAATDLSAEVALRHEAQSSEQRFRLLADRSHDVVMRIDLDPFRVSFINKAITELAGVTPEELYANPFLITTIIHPDDLERVFGPIAIGQLDASAPGEPVEYRMLHRDGTLKVVEAIAGVVIDGDHPPVIEATIRDVTSRARERDLLDRLASRDPLTGLFNRRALMAALELRLAERKLQVGGEQPAVLFFDLDRFKSVNDRLGHDVGDEVLVAFAEMLGAAVRADDVVARLAGDEFVVLAGAGHADAIATRVVAAMAAPIRVTGGGALTVGVSVGIAVGDGGGSGEQLLRQADLAMYEAKRRGSGHVVQFRLGSGRARRAAS